MSYIKRMLQHHGELNGNVVDFLQDEGFERRYKAISGYVMEYEEGKISMFVKYGRIAVEVTDGYGNYEKGKAFPFDNADFTSFKTQYYKAVDWAALHF